MGACTSSANRKFNDEAGYATQPESRKHHRPLSNLHKKRRKVKNHRRLKRGAGNSNHHRHGHASNHMHMTSAAAADRSPPPPPPASMAARSPPPPAPLPLYEQLEQKLESADVAQTPLDSGFIMLSDVSSFHRSDDVFSPLALAPHKSTTATPLSRIAMGNDASLNNHVLMMRQQPSALSDIEDADLEFAFDARMDQQELDLDEPDEEEQEPEQQEEEEEEDVVMDDVQVFRPPQYAMTLGDKVQLIDTYNSLQGTIKFIGRVHSKSDHDVFYGLQLNRPRQSEDIVYWVNQCRRHNRMTHVGDDGCIDGIEYFQCAQESQALFVKQHQIARVLRVNYEVPRIAIEQRVHIRTQACFGRVRYIGKPHDDDLNVQHDIYYGVELENKSSGSATDAAGTNGTFHGHTYFKCSPGFGVLLTATDLSEYVVPSRFNLLCHGFLFLHHHHHHEKNAKYVNIASRIVKLIEWYTNLIEFRLTEQPSTACSQQSRALRVVNADGEIYQKYQAFDVNHNICGPTIVVRKCGSHTQRKQWQTLITGHYQFFKAQCIDVGDRHIEWVNKTEYEIRKFQNGDTEPIYRSIDTDNELPLFKDYKSVRQQFRRDIHFNDVDNCDQQQVFNEICDLYGLSRREMMQQLNQYRIRLYGLNKNQCLKT